MSAHPVARRISTLCRDCDQRAADDMARLHALVRVEHRRLRLPPFGDVAAVWLKAVQAKESAIVVEIRGVEAILWDGELPLEIQKIIDRQFAFDQASCRVRSYTDSLRRAAERATLSFRPEEHGLSIADASYQAGLSNALQRARQNVADTLQRTLL